jgi:Flp pilus assembly protein TadD
MAAQDKKQRYKSKDYTEIVEFPVELVDRDGVVRRYSYQESLRVYNRRIASAKWRYTDESVVEVEVDHCEKRIDQLRRSYLHRCKNLGAELAGDRRTGVQFVLGEGLALLHEQLGQPLFGGLVANQENHLDIVGVAEDDNPAVYQVTDTRKGASFLLYVFVKGDDDALYQTHLKSLSCVEVATHEQLMVSREGETADFLLTRRLAADEQAWLEDAEVSGQLSEMAASRAAARDDESAPPPGAVEFSAGLAHLRKRQLGEAIRYFKEALDHNPYHREAYLALCTLLDTVGSVEEGEMYTALAVAYLPNDGLVRFNKGLNLLRQGRRAEALETFEIAASCDPELYQPRYFAGLVHAVEGRLGRAHASLVAAREHAGTEKARVDVALRWVDQRLRIRRWAVSGVGIALALAASVVWWMPLLAVPFGLVAVVILAAYPIQNRLARRWFSRYSLAPPAPRHPTAGF